MYFSSDNAHPASQKVMAAIVEANENPSSSYGTDPWTKKAEAAVSEVFEKDCTVFLVATGTAANTLALATITPTWGAVICHQDAHINTDECGGVSYAGGGTQLLTLPGEGAKIDAASVDAYLSAYNYERPHHIVPHSLSISQLTESGCRYDPDEIAALRKVADKFDLRMHMDGARFANAVAASGCTPAELTWKSGIDVLSLGGSKNGCLAVEGVVFFDKSLAESFIFRRMRAGHLLSKGRLLGAQMAAYLDDGHWLELASHANEMAQVLAKGLEASGRARLAWQPGGNEVFAILDKADQERLLQAGAVFYPWPGTLPHNTEMGEDDVLVRFVASFATPRKDAEKVGRILGSNN